MANENVSVNVHEITRTLLNASAEKEAKTTKAAKKPVSESVKRTANKKARKPFDIPCNHIRLESLTKFRKFLESDGEDEAPDAADDYTPNDDVVVIVDPEDADAPEDVAEAEDAAEELIGQHVCKCSICGANYVTDKDITEDLETEEEECPVCGEVGEQILVGEIVDADEMSGDDEDELDGVDEEETEDGDDEDFEFDEFEEEETDDDFEEAVQRSRARTARRKFESARKAPVARRARTARPVRKAESVAPKRTARKRVPACTDFDEKTLSRMLTTFAKENYSNVKFVKITSGTVRGKRLTLEGTVTTTKGSKQSIKFVCENFVPAARMSLRFREVGPFTESVKGQKTTFIIECAKRGTTVVPTLLRYNYKAKNAGVHESKALYSVSGKVLAESARPAKTIQRPVRKARRK